MNGNRVVIFGPGPQFKGGLANYATSMAKKMDRFQGTEVYFISWTQQYPAIIPRDFIDRRSKEDLLKGSNVKIKYITNYNNPFSWYSTYRYIRSLHPDMLIIHWSIAIQGIPLGFIVRKIKKNLPTEVIFDLHSVFQKEKSSIDRMLSRYGLGKADTYIAHAYKAADELQAIFPEQNFKINETGQRAPSPSKTIIKLYHPVYQIFQPTPQLDKAKIKEQLNLRKYVFLFFGFIRKYKGLHYAIQAFAEVARQRDDVSLLIVGESFWETVDTSKWSVRLKKTIFQFLNNLLVNKKESEVEYRPLDLISTYGIEDRVTTINKYVPNEEVHKYFQVSDALLLFYISAMSSGVESIAYNFNLPLIATKVGHFPENIQDGFNGYLAEPDNIEDMTQAMFRFLDHPIPAKNVAESAKKLSWENYIRSIIRPPNDTSHPTSKNQ